MVDHAGVDVCSCGSVVCEQARLDMPPRSDVVMAQNSFVVKLAPNCKRKSLHADA